MLAEFLVLARNEDFQVVTGGYFEIRWEGAFQRPPPFDLLQCLLQEKTNPSLCALNRLLLPSMGKPINLLQVLAQKGCTGSEA